jgi:hypothetical protein
LILPPIGLAWRNGYVRCLSNSFDKKYLIQEMKLNDKNIIPICVLDETTKKAKTYLINLELTDFDLISDKILERKVETMANYMINKKTIQKSNKTPKEKEKECYENELRELYKINEKEIIKLSIQHMKKYN